MRQMKMVAREGGTINNTTLRNAVEMVFQDVDVKIQIGVNDRERRVKDVPRSINGKIVVKAEGKTFPQWLKI